MPSCRASRLLAKTASRKGCGVQKPLCRPAGTQGRPGAASCYNAFMRQAGVKPTRRTAKGYVIGRRAFARISAVEGIRTTAGMEQDFREFERQGLSAAERRKVISRKYGKPR